MKRKDVKVETQSKLIEKCLDTLESYYSAYHVMAESLELFSRTVNNHKDVLYRKTMEFSYFLNDLQDQEEVKEKRENKEVNQNPKEFNLGKDSCETLNDLCDKIDRLASDIEDCLLDIEESSNEEHEYYYGAYRANYMQSVINNIFEETKSIRKTLVG